MDRRRIIAALTSDEARLLILFLLVFTLFIQWNSTNAYSRYDLTKALVEDGSPEIGPYAHNTLDKTATGVGRGQGFLNGTGDRDGEGGQSPDAGAAMERIFASPNISVYSAKPPMASVLAIPGYLAGEAAAEMLGLSGSPVWIHDGLVSTRVANAAPVAVKQFLMTFLVSALFGAVLLVLLYRHLDGYVDGDIALYTVLLAGLGTFLFHYSTTFFGVAAATTFGFASYLMLDRDGPRWTVWAAGILGGFAVATTYQAALIPFAIGLYLIAGRDRRLVPYAAAVAVGTLPLFIYNAVTTGNPFLPPFLHGVSGGPLIADPCHLYTACRKVLFVPPVSLEPGRMMNVAVRLLFYPTRGLLFYAPILLLAIPGTYELYRRDRRMLMLFPGVFVVFFLFSIVQTNWLSGVSFGPRYLIPGIPFLVLPMALGLKKMAGKGRAWQALILLVAAVSVVNMLLGFTGIPAPEFGQETYVDRFEGAGAVQPDLYPTLVERFAEYGPRSEVLMSMVGREKGFDVTFLPPYGPELLEIGKIGGSAVLLRSAVLPLVAVLVILGIMFTARRQRLLLAGGIALLLLAGLTASPVHVASDEYRGVTPTEPVLYGQDATVAVHATAGDVVRMAVEPVLPGTNATVTVAVDGTEPDIYNVTGYQPVYLSDVDAGWNTVDVSVAERCTVPARRNRSRDDVRCMTVRIPEITVLNREETPDTLLDDGWLRRGNLSRLGAVRMRDSGTIRFDASGNGTVPRLSLSPLTAPNTTRLTVSVNGKEVRTLTPVDMLSPVHLPGAAVREGWNTLHLDAAGGCATAPAGCEVRLEDFTQVDGEAVPNPLYLSGWYPGDGGVRKMNRKGVVRFTASQDGAVTLGVAPPAGGNHTVDIGLNGEEVRTVRVAERNITLATGLQDGWNTLRLHSDGCTVPAEADVRSNDTRCSSLDLHRFTVLPEDELPARLFTDGWYPESAGNHWMRGDAEMVVAADEKDVLRMVATTTPGYDGSLEVSVNGEHIRTIDAAESGEPVHLLGAALRDGKNVVRLETTAGCIVPTQHGGEDDRCLGFNVRNVSLVRRDVLETVFRDGWSQLGQEPGGRWLERNGTVHVRGRGSEAVRLDLGDAARNGTRIDIMLNGEQVRTVTTPLPDTVYLDGPLQDGENTVRFVADGCTAVNRTCRSVFLENLSVVAQDAVPAVVRGSGWYGTGPDRWMARSGTLRIRDGGGKVLRLGMVLHPDLAGETVDVVVDGETVRTLTAPIASPVHLDLALGTESTVRFRSSDCVEDGPRCISVQAANISLVDPDAVPDITYRGDWYRDADGRWLERNGTVRFRTPDGEVPRFDIHLHPDMTGAVAVRVNGERVRTLTAPIASPVHLTDAALRNGTNTVRFTADGCVVDGDRCISLRVENTTTTARDDLPRVIHRGNWHPAGTVRWLERAGDMLIDAGEEELMRLVLTPYSGFEGDVRIAVNGEAAATHPITSRTVVHVGDRLTAGRNRFTFEATDCVADGGACRSVMVNATPVAGDTAFGPGWHGAEDGGRWLERNGTLHVRQDRYGTVLRLNLSRYEHLANGTVRVWDGDEPARTTTVVEREDGGTIVTALLTGEPGWRTVQVESTNGCRSPAEEESGSTDDRCLSLWLANVSTPDGARDGRRYLGDWYGREEENGTSWRWMKERGGIAFTTQRERANISLTVDPYPGLSYPTLIIGVNGNTTRTLFPDDRTTVTVTADTVPGVNVLSLESGSGCRVPAEEDPESGDTRCLGFRLLDVTVTGAD